MQSRGSCFVLFGYLLPLGKRAVDFGAAKGEALCLGTLLGRSGLVTPRRQD